MSLDQWLVTLAGIAAAAFVAWFFWGSRRAAATSAAVNSDGEQEVLVIVKGGYSPDRIEVRAGVPVRLRFRREETVACTETVLIPDLRRSAQLPQGETVDLVFTPQDPADYEFSCQMGMFRGHVIVR